MKTQARDMTEGSIAKNIILFYIPLAIGGLFQQLYSFVDSVVVGRGIGAQALAAVGATSIVVWLTLGFAMGITKGFCIHISQAYGKKDYHLVNRGFFVASVLSLIVGTMISIVGSLAIRDFLILMHTPGEILEQSLDYIKVILLGFVITVLNNLFMSVLQSLGDSSTPFWALLVSSVTNIGLDCVFVLTLKWGVQGAAAATVLSQVFSLAICGAGLKRLKFVSVLDGSKSKNARLTVRMLKTGLPVGIMSMVTAVGGMILQFFVNDLGASAVAAYAASTKIRSVIGEFSNALGMTFMTFVGQNYGAQKYDRIKDGVRTGVLLSILIHIPLSAVEIFGGKRIASLMVTDSPVLELCGQYLLIVGIFVFFLGFLMVFRNCIQGMGNTWIPMLSGGLEVFSRLIFGYWLGRHSFMGIAAAEASAWISVSIMLGSSFFILFRKVLRTQTPENTTDTKNIRTIS